MIGQIAAILDRRPVVALEQVEMHSVARGQDRQAHRQLAAQLGLGFVLQPVERPHLARRRVGARVEIEDE
ncbi:MAG: hypothetical protein V4502_13250 [Pseudomonadota bacterium]